MKKFIVALTVALTVAFSVSAQQEKTLKKVDKDYYAYSENTIKDANHQTGFYKNLDGKLVRDGKWKHFINGELVAEAKYSDDKLVALIVDNVEYTTKDLQIIRLKRKGIELSESQ